MEEANDILMMYRLMFGDAAGVARRGASAQLESWAQAFEAWMEARRKEKPSMLKTARLAWGRFLKHCGKMPWELGAGDIEAHAAWMVAQGCSPGTAYAEQGMILDFYACCRARGLQAQGELSAVRRLRLDCYARAQALSREEVEALLGLMRRDASPLGRRDYAFVLARLRLGVPLSDIRRLTWGQIEAHETGAWVRWRAGAQRRPLPGEVWEAIQAALRVAGRLETMTPEQYLFVSLAHPNTLEGGRAQDWLSDRCQSNTAHLASLKTYGKAAGIAEKKLNMTVLRTTAIKLRLEQGASVEEMQAFMESRTSARHLRYKLRKLREVEASGVPAVGLAEGEPQVPVRAKPFVEGDGLKHGLYARRQPPEAVQALLREDICGVEEQVVGLRTLARGLLERQAQAQTALEAAQLGDCYSKAAYRLADLIQAEKKMGAPGEQAMLAQEILEQMDAAAVDLGGEPVSPQIRAQAQGGEAHLGGGDRRLVEEIAALRYVLRNVFRLAMETQDVREYMRLVEIYGGSCYRLVSMLRSEAVDGERLLRAVEEVIQEAIDEAGRRLGISL